MLLQLWPQHPREHPPVTAGGLIVVQAHVRSGPDTVRSVLHVVFAQVHDDNPSPSIPCTHA